MDVWRLRNKKYRIKLYREKLCKFLLVDSYCIDDESVLSFWCYFNIIFFLFLNLSDDEVILFYSQEIGSGLKVFYFVSLCRLFVEDIDDV